MDNILKKNLLDAGLTENEAAVYLASLEMGETSVSRLAKKAGVKRTTTYLVLDSLKEKGLINTIKKNKMLAFYAEDPRKIHEILEKRKKNIDKIMPQLLAFTNLIDKKPEIRYFDGTDGIKEVYRDGLRYPGKELTAWFSEVLLTQFDEKFFYEEYIPARIKKKIWVRAILPDNEIIRKFIRDDEPHLRISKLIPQDKYHISIELNMYGINKVGIVSYHEQFGIIIESQQIYDSLKNIFELTWELLPENKL